MSSSSKRTVLIAIVFLVIGIGIGIMLIFHGGSILPGFISAPGIRLGADPSTLSSLAQTQAYDKRFTAVAKLVTPTVVSIHVRSQEPANHRGFEWFFGNRPYREASGSGVIVTANGYIITNNHVVEGADGNGITVILYDKRSMKAKLVGTDPMTDIAVIKLDASNLPAAVLGNSDVVEVGQWVLAVGNPFELTSTVTHGIVSAIGRGGLGIIADGQGYGIEDFIQTDAAINPGNSGGALVNLNGEVIGINSAIATSTSGFQGYGFAIPINLVRSTAEELIRSGKITRGYIGVQIRTLDADKAKELGLSKPEGVLIESAVSGGAAATAGLKSGDVILGVDGQSMSESNQLQAYIARKHPGERVTLKIFRAGNTFDKSVTLQARTADSSPAVADRQQEQNPPPKRSDAARYNVLGFSVRSLSSPKSHGVDYGVIVEMVRAGSAVQRRGLSEGDIIIEADKQQIHSVDELSSIISDKQSGSAIMFRIKKPDNSTALIFVDIP